MAKTQSGTEDGNPNMEALIWELQSWHRYRWEGMFLKFVPPPPHDRPYDLHGNSSKIVCTDDFLAHTNLRGDLILVREHLSAAYGIASSENLCYTLDEQAEDMCATRLCLK